jgi:hypothetical protein
MAERSDSYLMSNQPGGAKPSFTMFKGIDQRPEGQTFVVDGFNVDFYDGAIGRRRGRQKLLVPGNTIPYRVWTNDGGTTWTDVTTNILPGGAGIVNPFAGANYNILIGCPYKFEGINVTITANMSTNVTLTTSRNIRNAGTIGFDGQWSSFSNTDNTTIAAFTMKKTGTVLWDSSTFVWDVGDTATDAANFQLVVDQQLFWVKLTTSGVGNCTISSIRIVPQGNASYSSATELSGLFEFVTRGGERTLVGSQDVPSRNVDASAANETDIRVFKYDLSTGEMISVRLPTRVRIKQVQGIKTSFVTFNGWLLGTTSAGVLWKYDGANNADYLEALPGMDAQMQVIGAQGYLNSTPLGTQLEIYHGKLMVTCCPDNPLGFYASITDGDINTVPQGASVGGPNVWPQNGIFKIPGREGDYVVGASVVNDRYVIFTRNNVWVYDETALRMTNGDVGCVATGSIQKVDQNVYFLSDRGVFVSDGVNTTCISEPVNKFLMERVNWRAAQLGAASAHNKRDGEYWLWLPINGDYTNSVAVIYNYIKQLWRISGGMYPWIRNNYNTSVAHSVTAACSAKTIDGKQMLISADINGILWQENITLDDDGYIYPAYAVLREFSSQGVGGEDYSTFREWYLDAKMDGAWVECYALNDGERFDQEIDRRYNGQTSKSEVIQKQFKLENAVDAGVGATFAPSPAAWSGTTHSAKQKKMKYSFGRSLTKMQPAIHWTPGSYGGGNYNNNATTALGLIRDVQFDVKKKAGGR